MKKKKIKGVEGAFLISSNDYEDDDCPICQLMRKCEEGNKEPTEEELKNAMKEAKNVPGAVVGGEWTEEDD